MHQHHSRTILIDKKNLIEKIKENKLAHIKEFDDAVVAYAIEAKKQIKQMSKDVENGKLDIKLQLTTPINRASEYDKVIEMFNWEIAENVELTQEEFNEYIHDETSSSKSAKFANAFYTSKSL